VKTGSMTFLKRVAPALLVVPLIAVAGPATAQHVQYETVTKVDFPGGMGTAMRLAARLGGGSLETVETTYISGNRMRTDADGSSTITDLDAKRIISIDHTAKTYSIMTFEQMLAAMQQAGDAMARDVQAQRADANPGAEGRLNFRFSVDDPRQRERIAGYSADRFFLTMEAEGEYVPEGGEREQAGTLVVLTDIWSSKDMPAFQARQTFDQQTARDFADAGAALTQGIAAAFASDPQLQVAFEQSARETAKIEGIPVRTIVRFVSVAPGKTFDRQLAIAPRQEGPGVAGQAARAGLGRLARAAAGAASRQQEEAARPAQEQATQATFMTVTSEVRNVSTRAIDPKTFEPPAGYRQVDGM
jgi:hypothetical protein